MAFAAWAQPGLAIALEMMSSEETPKAIYTDMLLLLFLVVSEAELKMLRSHLLLAVLILFGVLLPACGDADFSTRKRDNVAVDPNAVVNPNGTPSNPNDPYNPTLPGDPNNNNIGNQTGPNGVVINPNNGGVIVGNPTGGYPTGGYPSTNYVGDNNCIGCGIPGYNPNPIPGTYPPGVYPPGTNPPGTYPPGTTPPGTYPPGVNPGPGSNPPIVIPGFPGGIPGGPGYIPGYNPNCPNGNCGGGCVTPCGGCVKPCGGCNPCNPCNRCNPCSRC